jgi:hypothetical protein
MRYYGFGNYYLSSLQQGLQAQHCVVEMVNSYNPYQTPDLDPTVAQRSPPTTAQIQGWTIFDDWAKNHKTIVLLNGGNALELSELRTFLMMQDVIYPYAAFREDKSSLNDCITSVGIILPPRIYETAAQLRAKTYDITVGPVLSVWEAELCERINACPLAR